MADTAKVRRMTRRWSPPIRERSGTRALGHSGTQALRRFTAAEPPAAGHIKVHGGIGSSIAARPIHARIKTPRFGGQMESGYNCAGVASMRSIAH
nr:hypothetical protein [Burkholderia pseudomallei]